jgi:hypothetical protein
MKPFAIVPRFTAEKELRDYRYDESNVVLTSQSHASMTMALSELGAKTVFVPTIDQHRRDLGFQGKALLFMDGLESHHTEQFLAECPARNIDVLFPIAHAYDQLQPLDLLTFSMMTHFFSVAVYPFGEPPVK